MKNRDYWSSMVLCGVLGSCFCSSLFDIAQQSSTELSGDRHSSTSLAGAYWRFSKLGEVQRIIEDFGEAQRGLMELGRTRHILIELNGAQQISTELGVIEKRWKTLTRAHRSPEERSRARQSLDKLVRSL